MVISPTGSTKKGAAAIGRRYARIKIEISNVVFSSSSLIIFFFRWKRAWSQLIDRCCWQFTHARTCSFIFSHKFFTWFCFPHLWFFLHMIPFPSIWQRELDLRACVNVIQLLDFFLFQLNTSVINMSVLIKPLVDTLVQNRNAKISVDVAFIKPENLFALCVFEEFSNDWLKFYGMCFRSPNNLI